MRMMIGDYCLATLREADYSTWEQEGYYWCRMGGLGFSRLPCCNDLEKAQTMLLDGIPKPCRPFVTWEGEV